MVNTDPDIQEKCRTVIQGKLKFQNKSWVLFQNQTFVVLDGPASSHEEASAKATELMKMFGPVFMACPAGDFNVLEDKNNGWIVTGHCQNMFTYVDSTQAKKEDGEIVIGLIGRSMRDKDGKNPKIVHIEL